MIVASTERRYGKDEFARRGDAIFENEVRPQLKTDDEGKFAAIDIETGAYEVAANELEAGDKLRECLPDAQIWIVRIGFRSVRRFGRSESASIAMRPRGI